MPPRRMWSEIGSSAKISAPQKHSTRITAVLGIRADGTKFPILFIVKAQPGGTIEERELRTYPPGHFYVVQHNAWMDARVWKSYVTHVLTQELVEPSIVLLDNFDAHVSDEGQRLMRDRASSTVAPLPPNSTSLCQPLDVGVMDRSCQDCDRSGRKRTRVTKTLKPSASLLPTEAFVHGSRSPHPPSSPASTRRCRRWRCDEQDILSDLILCL